MSKWVVFPLLALLACVLGTVLYFRWSNNGAPIEHTVSKGTLSRFARGVGKVESTTDAALLAFVIPGRIKRVCVEESQEVAQGTVLAELDVEMLDLEVAAAQAALDEARAHEKTVARKAREEDLKKAGETIVRASLELQAAEVRYHVLQTPDLPPPATPSDLKLADLDIERAKQVLHEAAYRKKQVHAGPTEDELAVSLARVSLAEWDWDYAKQKLAVAATLQFVTQTYPIKPEMERHELTANVERNLRKLNLARAEHDRLKRGASTHEKDAATASEATAKATYDRAIASKACLEKPSTPAPAGQAQIQQAKFAWDKAKSSEREAQAVLVALQALPNPEDAAAAAAATVRTEKVFAQAQARRQQAVLHAPFDGVIVGRYLEPGCVAQPAAPVLALSDLKHLRVRAEIPADWSGDLQTTQEVSLSCPALGGATPKGRISKVLWTIGPKSIFSNDPRETKGGEVATVLISLDEPLAESAKLVLRAGLRLEVTIAFQTFENVLCVPRSFVTWEDNQYVVYKAVPGQLPQLTPVEVGIKDDFSIQITKHVVEGDRLVKSLKIKGQ